MKKAYAIAIFCSLLFLFTAGSALAQPLDPGECALALDPGNCCDYAADEATRVDTARMILRVHARMVGNPPVPEDESHFHNSINGWAVNGSGEDLYSDSDLPAVYQESSASHLTRQEMWEYLQNIFAWSSDMELVIGDEVWETHPDGSMTYMLLNKWFGTFTGSNIYYEQPGISIVKFRPGEGCASYQRDFFTEGDLYWGMAQSMVMSKRNAVITELGLTDKCVDDDGDGYTKYAAATGCANPGLDCDDYHAAVNPGATEIYNNEIDDDCNPRTSDIPPWGTPASVINAEYKELSDLTNTLFLLCLPIGAVLILKRLRSSK